MRGEIVPDARPSRTRNLLIGAQVMASALLLICSAIFLRSAFAASMQDPGIRISDTAVVPIGNEAFRRQVVDAVRRDPVIAAVAASHPDPVFGSRPAVAESTRTKSTAAYKFVSPEFFGVLGIDVVRGRPFSAAENHVSAAVVIVAASFAKLMWPEGDALGQVLRLAPDPAAPPREGSSLTPPTGAFTVIGVARDVAGFVMAEDKPANVYVPTSAAEAGTILSVRVHGDPETARRALMQRLSAIDPNVGDVVTLRTIAGLATYFLQVAFWLTLVLGALALALTLSGLFSVLSYLVERRTKEIGVRMALGATAADVGRLVLAQTIRPVGIGMTIGAGVAVALAVALLASPAAATIGALVRVLDPVAYGASLVVIVLACGLAASAPTLRAARIDPMTSLRHE